LWFEGAVADVAVCVEDTVDGPFGVLFGRDDLEERGVWEDVVFAGVDPVAFFCGLGFEGWLCVCVCVCVLVCVVVVVVGVGDGGGGRGVGG
jgi:hypothetical protein